MPADKTGRNDPCPCGSGRKYKRCCLHSADAQRAEDLHQSVTEELHEAIGEQAFASMEEAQAFIKSFQVERNQRPVDDFRGLSPERMHRLLHAPLDSPEVMQVSTLLESEPDAPLAQLFGLLAEAIGGNGLKPTAKGNFPRNPCREIMQAWLGEGGYDDYTRFGAINREDDAPELHVTRVVAELAGFLRKYRGRFILSRPARDMLAATGQRALYPQLFRTYASEFNWGYRDRYPEAPIVQQGWGFTAYLLSIDGHQPQPATFYADAFHRAFPAIDHELEDDLLYRSPEELLRSLYTTRARERFADFTGIATVRDDADDILTRPQTTTVQAAPLLHRLISFPSGQPPLR
ncbi:hypothetical protein SPICUR_05595 [Spiribacter curvatus]|uniref:SEC-C motif-containing protein n=1 Tax=Spiribacter curvatus TaxID=1335757 RepID=U5T6Y7_9GAMM|nr:SEC-C metal-binding domain-containing protein [Spiribacter curvatus]AGY92093.1 hypothetical protein SPICUR_05595 [Spiribacter curvatus]